MPFSLQPSKLSAFLCALFVIGALSYCGGNHTKKTESQVIVAVDNRVLTIDKIRTLIHPQATAVDSLAIFNAFVDNWIRDQLLMREASKLYATDIEIEQLVHDYRESLLKFRLEESIIKERFDSTITANDLYAFYNQYKTQFILRDPIYRCLMVQMPSDHSGLKLLQKAWKERDLAYIAKIGESFVLSSIIDTTQWYTWSEIDERSSGLFTDPVNKRVWEQEKTSDSLQGYLKIIDTIDKSEVSPLSYIQDQLVMMILHTRRKKIIEDYRQELYNQALRNNEIKL